MIQRSRKIIIKRVPHSSEFYRINKKVFLDTPAKIGSSTTATTNMVMNTEELRMIMPEVLGLDPKSVHSNWDKAIRNYFDSISKFVPEDGLHLEVGFMYDIDDVDRKEALTRLTKAKSIATTKDLADFVEGLGKDGKPNVEEAERYKYGIPINKADYIMYRYASFLGDVANTPDLVSKAPGKIRFFMVDETQVHKEEIAKRKLRTEAMKAYTDVISDEEETDNMIYALMDLIPVKFDMLETDKHEALEKVMNSFPEHFVKTSQDKNLKLRAKINRYIHYGILRKLEGTDIIVDADNPSDTIGNTMDAVVNYMSNAANKDKVSNYEAKFKSLVK